MAKSSAENSLTASISGSWLGQRGDGEGVALSLSKGVGRRRNGECAEGE